MASYTTRLNLKKPAASENYNVDDSNENMQKIDNGIIEVENKISKKGWWTLLNYETVSTATVFTTYSNRKISDFSGGLLVLSWLNEGLVRGTTIIPMTKFIDGTEVDVYHINTSGERKWLAITRVSDTSIRVNTNETAGVNKAFVCSILGN